MDSKKCRQCCMNHLLKFCRYPLSIAKLCETLKASDKTIYRDIQEFWDPHHAPICSNEQGYHYDPASAESFELPGTWFSNAELYVSRSNQKTGQRTLSPQHLTHYRDNWYLDAWCHTKKALRTFLLDNIQKTTALTEEADL